MYITHQCVAINYHFRVVSFTIFNFILQLVVGTMWDMLLYLIFILLVIVLYFLTVIIISEHVRKSIFADLFTSKLISLWFERLFTPLKFYQLKEFSELKSQNELVIVNLLKK